MVDSMTILFRGFQRPVDGPSSPDVLAYMDIASADLVEHGSWPASVRGEAVPMLGTLTEATSAYLDGVIARGGGNAVMLPHYELMDALDVEDDSWTLARITVTMMNDDGDGATVECGIANWLSDPYRAGVAAALSALLHAAREEMEHG